MTMFKLIRGQLWVSLAVVGVATSISLPALETSTHELINSSLPYVAATQTISQQTGLYYSTGTAVEAAVDAFGVTLPFPEPPGVHWSAVASSRPITGTQIQFRNTFGPDPVHATYTFTLVGQAAP